MNQYQVQEFEPLESIEGKHYFITETVKSCILRKQISDHLRKHRPGLKEVHSVDDCNVILVFCHIVSRAGTDIDAALNKLNTCSASTPAIFMVFHHTFDPYKILPDGSRHVTRRNTLTVDCLFYEDVGLLTCDINKKALNKIVQCFKYQDNYLDILRKCMSVLCCCFCWIFGKLQVRKSEPNILRRCMSCLRCCCCWIFGKLQALCNAIFNCFRRGGRGTGESGINDEGRKLISEGERKSV